MSEATPPPSETEPTTAPIAAPPAGPPTGYLQQQPSRLNKAAAWVGIAAGSVFIVAVIFGAGVFVGKNIDDGPRFHVRGHGMVGHPGPAMFPMGPRDGFDRGPVIEAPRPPGGPAAPTPSAAPRP
ncbi:hypothetical protein [Mycobacterium sp. NAZ190054]|uniref:hypothetical protein n=1 Tax=Mycobacterium sp. NAZ190054 TaxID=1747766 RepID=UPI00079A0418|nr:hypothetical protein [Mycobacterium sp. NAZ190054]KWX68723.1 hypothetical protein ASJ79_16455 [Mycobacterium sp. NAZ190054]